MSRTKMQIRVDTDDHIDGSQELAIRVERVVEGSLDRFRDRLTRVEIHLSRLSRQAGERYMCCRMEAQSGNLKPIAVSHEAPMLTEAIHAASAKLERAVHAALGRVEPKDAAEPVAQEEGRSAEGLGHLRSF
ncbi:MAG: HPF/RaiA family ribosome-associated protein [Steroidobacteraceae bacterium]